MIIETDGETAINSQLQRTAPLEDAQINDSTLSDLALPGSETDADNYNETPMASQEIDRTTNSSLVAKKLKRSWDD